MPAWNCFQIETEEEFCCMNSHTSQKLISSAAKSINHIDHEPLQNFGLK
jgi:hypothetical protein